MSTPGYSGTPLLKKLGIKPGFRITTRHAPVEYFDWLGTLPETVEYFELEEAEVLQFIHVFVSELEVLNEELPSLKRKMSKDGMLWISWPKKASKLATDLDGNIVRAIGLDHGLVDTKVCAVSEVWSGLKFMYRLKDR